MSIATDMLSTTYPNYHELFKNAVVVLCSRPDSSGQIPVVPWIDWFANLPKYVEETGPIVLGPGLIRQFTPQVNILSPEVLSRSVRLPIINPEFYGSPSFQKISVQEEILAPKIPGESVGLPILDPNWFTYFVRDVDDSEEKWRSLDFAGYSKYEISNWGSLKTVANGYTRKGTDAHGYCKSKIASDQGKVNTKNHHLLVLMTFFGPPPNESGGYTVDHINREKKDNRISNLRWATSSEQSYNRKKRGKINANTPVVQITPDGKTEIMTWLHIKDIVKAFGMDQGYLSRCCSSGAVVSNFKWRYATDSIPGENWRQLSPNKYDSVYISDFGRYRRGNKIGFGCEAKGYKGMTLKRIDGTRKSKFMHRLVMKVFVGKDKRFVNHMDTNKRNNKLSNLEYVTPSENIQHAVDNDLINYNPENKPRRPVNQYDLQGNFIKSYPSIQEAREATGINNIGKVCRGEYKTAGNFIWRYAN